MQMSDQITLKNWDQMQQYLFSCIKQTLVEKEGLSLVYIKQLALTRDPRVYPYLASPISYKFGQFLKLLKAVYTLCPYVLRAYYKTDPVGYRVAYFDKHGVDLIFNLDRLSKLSLEQKTNLAFALFDLCTDKVDEDVMFPQVTQFEMSANSPELIQPGVFREFIIEDKLYWCLDKPSEGMLKKYPVLEPYSVGDLTWIKLLYKKLFYNQAEYNLWWVY